MAHGDQGCVVDPVHADTMNKKSTSSRQQKRLELEQEVAKLHKMLDNEEKVHQVLERALLPNAGPTLHIPSFLPKKAKELLAELVMVEDEISRLESEISKIKQGLNDVQQVKAQEAPKHASTSPVTPPNRLPMLPIRAPESKGMQEKLALETKSMFFINQAIKGDYAIHGFSSKGKVGSSVGSIDKKEIPKVVKLQEKVPRKSGVIEKPTSPKLPPRHPTPSPPEQNPEISFNFLREPSSNSSSSEVTSQKWQPNKLSERILKCLICIFMRLIRTSRAIEIEKLSNVPRSTHTSLSLRSLRAESNLSIKANHSIQRETAQQDPYGIFEIDDSLVRDIGPYKNFVRFTSSSLDLKGISSSLPLLKKLRALMNTLHEVDLRFLTHMQKLAFWINMYNTCIMHGLIEHGLPSYPEKVLALRNKAVINIGGNKLNALAIEHFILRQPSSMKEVLWKGEKNDREDAVRRIYGLEHPEPNITFALCCGSKSSPAVRIYTADGVLTGLEKAKLEYLQASIVVTATKRLMIPKLLLWNMHDFAKDLDSLVDWICNQLPTSGSLRKSMAECLKGQNNGNISDIVDILPYDFEFQYLLAA